MSSKNIETPSDLMPIIRKVEDAIKLGVKSLKKVLDNNFNADRVDAAFIMADEKVFRKVARNKIKDYLK